MPKAVLISSITGFPRSIRVIEQDKGKGKCDVGGSLLRCKFNFPDGTYPLSVIAMVTDKDQKIMTPVSAETIELMHNEPLIDVR